MSVRPTLSVIICAYTLDRWSDTLAAIDSVRRQTQPAMEIILVVDHNPALSERARAHFRDVLVIDNMGQPGLSDARNAGIAVAQGEVVAFLDDDAVAAPDWLEHLVAGYRLPNVVGVGGHIEPMWVSPRPAWFPEEFGWVVGCSYRGAPDHRAPVRNLIGANMSFRRDAIQWAGGFRAGVGQVGASMLRCDDTEFCIRLRQRVPEAVLLHEPAARVQHRVPRGRARWSYFRLRCYTEGQAKAQVARIVGGRDALSTERAYVLRVLPSGVTRAVLHAVLRRDAAGLARAAAIVGGLGLTAAGYVRGRLVQGSAA